MGARPNLPSKYGSPMECHGASTKEGGIEVSLGDSAIPRFFEIARISAYPPKRPGLAIMAAPFSAIMCLQSSSAT